jgi:hypothetical protein
LKDHEGFSTYFVLNIVTESGSQQRVLELYSSLRPQFSIPYFLKDDNQWAVFGRVESVVKAREDRFKTACYVLPYFSFLLLVVLLAIVSTIVGRTGHDASFSTAANAIGWIFATFMVIIGGVGGRRTVFIFETQGKIKSLGRKIAMKGLKKLCWQ